MLNWIVEQNEEWFWSAENLMELYSVFSKLYQSCALHSAATVMRLQLLTFEKSKITPSFESHPNPVLYSQWRDYNFVYKNTTLFFITMKRLKWSSVWERRRTAIKDTTRRYIYSEPCSFLSQGGAIWFPWLTCLLESCSPNDWPPVSLVIL